MKPSEFLQNIQSIGESGNFYLFSQDGEIFKRVRVLIGEGKLAFLQLLWSYLPSYVKSINHWKNVEMMINLLKHGHFQHQGICVIQFELFPTIKVNAQAKIEALSRGQVNCIDFHSSVLLQKGSIAYFNQIPITDWIDMANDLICCFYQMEYFCVSRHLLLLFGLHYGFALDPKEPKEPTPNSFYLAQFDYWSLALCAIDPNSNKTELILDKIYENYDIDPHSAKHIQKLVHQFSGSK